MKVNQCIKTNGIHKIHFRCTTNPLRVYNESIKGIHEIRLKHILISRNEENSISIWKYFNNKQLLNYCLKLYFFNFR